jgi:hypothetical protein
VAPQKARVRERRADERDLGARADVGDGALERLFWFFLGGGGRSFLVVIFVSM